MWYNEHGSKSKVQRKNIKQHRRTSKKKIRGRIKCHGRVSILAYRSHPPSALYRNQENGEIRRYESLPAYAVPIQSNWDLF